MDVGGWNGVLFFLHNKGEGNTHDSSRHTNVNTPRREGPVRSWQLQRCTATGSPGPPIHRPRLNPEQPPGSLV